MPKAKRKSVATEPWLAQAERGRKPFESIVSSTIEPWISMCCNDIATNRRKREKALSQSQ